MTVMSAVMTIAFFALFHDKIAGAKKDEEETAGEEPAATS